MLYNCISLALKMSGKFEESTINNIKINSYSRYVSHKDLQKLGEKFNIIFKVENIEKIVKDGMI